MGILIASPGWECKNYMKFTYSSHKYLWSIYHMPGTILGTCSAASVMSDSVTPWTVAHQAPLSVGFPSKNTGVGCHFLLQGFFLTQGSNSHLLHWQAGSLPLGHQGSPWHIINTHYFLALGRENKAHYSLLTQFYRACFFSLLDNSNYSGGMWLLDNWGI